MSVKTIADLKTDNTAKIYDNTTQDITGTILHDLLRDILDSSLNRETDPFIMSNVLLVDSVYGSGGRRGDFFNRYPTIALAEADATYGDVIWVLPGSHVTSGGRGVAGLTYNIMEGAEVACTTTMFGGTGISYRVMGKGKLHVTSGFVFYCQGNTIRCEAKILSSNGSGIIYAEGGRYDFVCEQFTSVYDAFVLDCGTGHAFGDEDWIKVKADTGFSNHTAAASLNTGGSASTGLVLIDMNVGVHTVGWTGGGGGWAGFNVGGEIRWDGLLRRQNSVSDTSGAWFYAHGIAPADSTIRFKGRTLLISDDGANWSEMRYGFRNDSNQSFNFYLEAGSYLHCHDYTDPTSATIYWSGDTSGLLDLQGTLDQNGDSGSSGNCIRFMNATVWPTVEFKGCDMKQTGGYATDTVYLNAGSTTYIGKLLFRDGPFPGSFTNSITGLEVDY